MLWSGPVGVVGAFDLPSGHFAFDDAGRRVQAPGWVEAAEQQVQEPLPQALVGVRVVMGEKRPGGRGTGG